METWETFGAGQITMLILSDTAERTWHWRSRRMEPTIGRPYLGGDADDTR